MVDSVASKTQRRDSATDRVRGRHRHLRARQALTRKICCSHSASGTRDPQTPLDESQHTTIPQCAPDEPGWRGPCSAPRVRARWLAWIGVVLAFGAFLRYGGLDALMDFAKMYVGTPHERYAARLERGWVSESAAADVWLSRAEHSLGMPRPIHVPRRDELTFPAHAPEAVAFVVPLRRGQRFIADADVDAPGRIALFVDVFVQEGAALRHVGNAARDESFLALEIRADGDYVLRVQPELGSDVVIRLVQRAEPTLRLPVEGGSATHIQSSFGDPRDQGRRGHEGIDIFAERGTKVLAAGDGFVSSVGTNRLGGQIVWVLRPSRGEAHYYAHLDTQLVRVGTRVKAGDVIGTVGNTGNARSTPPHLHFGIYAAGGAVDPLPYVVDLEHVAASRISVNAASPNVDVTPDGRVRFSEFEEGRRELWIRDLR